jgi:hypothetical protein
MYFTLNKNIIFSLFFLFLGISLVFFFHIGSFFPVGYSVALMITALIYYLWKFRQKHIGILGLYCFIIFFSPFIHVISYSFTEDFQVNPFVLGNLTLYDEKVIQLAAMIGATSAIGAAFSVSFFNKKKDYFFQSFFDKSKLTVRTLPLPLWFFWFFFGLLFFVGTIPVGGSMFKLEYHLHTDGILDLFPSSMFISYIVIIFLFVDSFLDFKSKLQRLTKKLFLLLIIFFIIKSISTGTREASSLIFSIIIFYYIWAKSFINNKIHKPEFKKIFFFIIIIFLIFEIIGYLRHALIGANLEDIVDLLSIYSKLEYLTQGPWSPILKNVLSVAEDYIEDIPFKLGKDYYNLFISIPPSFVSDFFNYDRPITGFTGPAFELRYGHGGSHGTVLPFRNFGLAGVFFISAICFSIILYLEKICTRNLSVVRLSFLCTLVFVMPFFLWYSEKVFISCFLILLLLSFIYQISLTLLKKT